MTLQSQKHAGKFSRKALPSTFNYYVTQQVMELKGSGEWRDAICPFHADTKPSLRINVARGAYRCMVCGARGGDVLAFHMHLHSMSFVAACKTLGAWVGG